MVWSYVCKTPLDEACRIVLLRDMRELYHIKSGDTIRVTALDEGILITREPPEKEKQP